MLLFLAKSLSALPVVSVSLIQQLEHYLDSLLPLYCLFWGRSTFKWLYLKGYKDYPREYGKDSVGSKKTPQQWVVH